MLRKLRNRERRAVAQRRKIEFGGFELGLSIEEVIADLDYGVGPIADTALLVQEGRREAGSAA